MRMTLLVLCAFLASARAEAFSVFNLNVFDQLQGEWPADFRARRMAAVADYVNAHAPDVVVFEEAKGEGTDSPDAASLREKYPHHLYVHESNGADGASYGYWIGAKRAPRRWIRDGFSFPGGVDRKVIGAVFDHVDGGCLGVLGLHLSYQNSEVRQREAKWLLTWLKKHERLCARWLVTGDFNADEHSAEMKRLFAGGLNSLYADLKPTIGAYNPIRRIYGENIPSQTIDWALGWNLRAQADVILDTPYQGEWVSDHAAVWVDLDR